ncbi:MULTISPECIES: hypothetical protein [Pseudomonas]|uniref:hypothetical protein n=1 Tax=Pseudomonas TaxID=286 RepID=UPI000DAC90D1|nr:MULTISPECIES: hypothetical protein [Pseudomonas]MCA5973047.1 hypothetical protein [Pseudomonas sp. P135]MCH5534190.1 hypothetical protein [Pseudomonas syringae pv. syringae]MCH5570141.1 hypothetical protein [Pseudomonas syringae pv. syringae]
MRRKLEFWGALGTAFYLTVMITVVALKLDDFINLKLNELGDFLAGAFGPIAFLWLILGFLQQGRELKLSTDALQLQAEELRYSVEQQSIMAAAAMQQIEARKTALEMQKREIEESISPIFRFVAGARSGADGGFTRTSTQVVNEGREVRDVLVTFEPPISDVGEVVIGKIPKNSPSQNIVFLFSTDEAGVEGSCKVLYRREDGKRVREIFRYWIPVDNPFVFIERCIPFVREFVEP